jgi:N-acetylglutamate synthase-like GNAT family acetyltransferase
MNRQQHGGLEAAPEIDYLADHLELAPLLAAWHHREWAGLLPGWSLEEAEAELRSHVQRRCVPTTFVALEGDRPVGSASLLAADLDGWEHLSPWVASVYVVPERRGRGLGRRLVARAVEEARALGLTSVYLFTAGQEGYYARLGWSPVCRTAHRGREVVILRRPAGD